MNSFTAPTTAPTAIILVNRTCNAITLKWGAPPSTGGLPVLKYTLKISNNLQHRYFNVTSPSATLHQMEPNTKYALAVRAVNFIGHSEWTESVMVTTLKRGTHICTVHIQNHRQTQRALIIGFTIDLRIRFIHVQQTYRVHRNSCSHTVCMHTVHCIKEILTVPTL